MFRHPKYYKELRKLRNKEARVNDHSASISDQVISANKLDGDMKVRAPGQGLKHQASSTKLQAPSTKRQAFEPTRSIAKRQASSPE